MTYKHLSQDHRSMIFALHRADYSLSAIAGFIGFNRSTISRELRRNSIVAGYGGGEQAHRRAMKRRRLASSIPRKFDQRLGAKLAAFSPRDVFIPATAAHVFGVSHQGIYDYLHRLACAGSHARPARRVKKNLKKKPLNRLRRGLGSYRKRGKCAPPPPMGDATPIIFRPPQALTREDFGHWEIDTMWCRHGTVLVIVERKDLFLCACLLEKKTAAATAKATVQLLARLPVKSLTSDRGWSFRIGKKWKKRWG